MSNVMTDLEKLINVPDAVMAGEQEEGEKKYDGRWLICERHTLILYN